jgi:hypothetical protein
MVLSPRLRVLLVVLVMVLALGIIGVLGAVGSASPNNNDHRDDKGRTLTVVSKTPRDQSLRPGSTRAHPGRFTRHQRPALQRERKGKDRAPRPLLCNIRPRR